MSNTFIQEAFQNAYLTEDAEEFSLNVSGPDDTESFLDIINADDDEMISDVYDLEAEAKEELKQSYIGKVILDCNVCHSNVFFDKDQITEDEDGLCCVDIECPYCMSNEGYTIIGEVKPFIDEEEPVDEIEDVEVTVSEDEPEIEDVEEETDEEELEEGFKESFKVVFRSKKKLNEDFELIYPKLRFSENEIKAAIITAAKEVNFPVEQIDLVEYIVDKDSSGSGEPECELVITLTSGFEISIYDDDIDISDFETLVRALSVEFRVALEDGYLEEGLKADEVAELRGAEEINGADGPLNSDLEGSDEIRGPKYTELNEGCEDKEELEECGDPELMKEGAIGSALGAVAGAAITKSPSGAIKGAQIGNAIGDTVGDIFTEDEELTEDIEDVSVTTSDETMTMTTKEDGGVVIETSPNEEEIEEYSGEEMIAPLEPETEVDVEDAIEANDEEEEEIPEDEMIIDDEFEEGEPEEEDFEEFDEESFDELGESYLKRCYENVTSFKTSGITMNENKEFIIEGKIGFDSGNEKDTQFIFSPKTNENGKLKLEGFNKQISKGKKTFKLNCSINDKALVCESLNYNYKGKNDLNESVRVYGTVKRK